MIISDGNVSRFSVPFLREAPLPLVRFEPSGVVVEVASNSRLFDVALDAGLPVASSCSGEAVCGKCHMRVLAGDANLSPKGKLEERLLAKEKSPPENRISCLTKVRGDATITTSYW